MKKRRKLITLVRGDDEGVSLKFVTFDEVDKLGKFNPIPVPIHIPFSFCTATHKQGRNFKRKEQLQRKKEKKQEEDRETTRIHGGE